LAWLVEAVFVIVHKRQWPANELSPCLKM